MVIDAMDSTIGTARGRTHGSVVETLHLEESHRMAEMPQDYFQMGIFLISRKEFFRI